MYHPITPKADIHNVTVVLSYFTVLLMLKSGLLKANQIRAIQPLGALFASKSIVTLVFVLQLMFCFYYYSFLSKGGKSLKDEDKLESFDVKDGGRLYVKDLARYDSIML